MELWAARVIGSALFIVALPSIAQIRNIDATRLPQSPAVQAAFRSAQDLEPYSRSWTSKWNYNIPKAQVQDKLADDVGILSHALQSDPANHELQLLTGLVAHFAYNVNDEAAFQVATDNLSKAAAADPTDIRGEWFLGIHQCQSLLVSAGMNRLMTLEAKVKNPPDDFWYDYITCATVALMPAHTLRAIDRSVAGGQPAESYKELAQIANSRYKTADLTKSIPAHDAWTDKELPNDRDFFTSRLCGVSFVVNVNSDIQIPDVANSACYAMASPPAKKGEPAPTFLLITRPPAVDQSLDDFARSYLKAHDVSKDNDAQVTPAVDLPCPVEHCLSLDLVVPSIYSKQGGGHFLIVAFERDQPRYDGLPFEKPEDPIKKEGLHGRAYFRAEPVFHRIPGKLYYMVLLDSNQQIFPSSKPQFEEFLKSIVVD